MIRIINGFSKISGYKVNMQKCFAFLYNSNKQKFYFVKDRVLDVCLCLQIYYSLLSMVGNDLLTCDERLLINQWEINEG